MDNFHPYPVEQNGNDCQQAIHYVQCSLLPAGNRCRFVLLDKDESCPTADLSNIRLSQWYGLAYSTGELLNTPLDNGMDMMKTQPEGGGAKMDLSLLCR